VLAIRCQAGSELISVIGALRLADWRHRHVQPGRSNARSRQKRAGLRDAVRAPAHTDTMPVRLHHIVIDAHDLPGLARFWTQALGWQVLSERKNEIVIGAEENAPVGICFMSATDPKTVKNRVHVDLTSSATDRDQEIDRLLALGARRVDIGQTGAESWTVLADPEGNEFCVVRPKKTLISLSSAPSSRDRPCPGQKSVPTAILIVALSQISRVKCHTRMGWFSTTWRPSGLVRATSAGPFKCDEWTPGGGTRVGQELEEVLHRCSSRAAPGVEA
jgi:predicted enzyme related to lactoylglutathione lyase